MAVVIYDISTRDVAGKRRLRHIERECRNWGTPVQASAYECELDETQYRAMLERLKSLICSESDSVRIYLLGNHFQRRRVVIGRKGAVWDLETFVI